MYPVRRFLITKFASVWNEDVPPAATQNPPLVATPNSPGWREGVSP